MNDDLTWRLDAIHAELDNLVMYAAAWRAMTLQDRRDVHARWNGIVNRGIDNIRWHWHQHARGESCPDWWERLRVDFADNQAIIDFMKLQEPDLSDPGGRWVLRWVQVAN
jgi:hypothetical protein